jgi:hypothetical protein
VFSGLGTLQGNAQDLDNFFLNLDTKLGLPQSLDQPLFTRSGDGSPR